MPRRAQVLGGMMLVGSLHGCARRQAPPQAPLAPASIAPETGAAASPADAAPGASHAAREAPDAPDAAQGPCDVMRASADWTAGANRSSRHLAERRIEDAIQQFFERQVNAGGIDDRRFRDHPVVFERLGTSPGLAVAACVASWDAADPGGLVPGHPPHFAPDHRYAEVTFEFNDASDGEYAYTAFVDVTVIQVEALFHYDNFQP